MDGEIGKEVSGRHFFNLFYPEPMTILELAEIVREALILHTNGKIVPEIKIVDKGLPILFDPEDKRSMHTDMSDLKSLFGIEKLKSPKETIFETVNGKYNSASTR